MNNIISRDQMDSIKHGAVRVIIDGLGDYQVQVFIKRIDAKPYWNTFYMNKCPEKAAGAARRAIAKRDTPEILEQLTVIWTEDGHADCSTSYPDGNGACTGSSHDSFPHVLGNADEASA